MGATSKSSERVLDEIRCFRKHIAIMLNAAVTDNENTSISKARLKELEHEIDLLKQAKDVLMTKAMLSPSQRQANKEMRKELLLIEEESKMLDSWDGDDAVYGHK